MPNADRHTEPTLLLEREWLARGAPLVIGLDEVGRGAIAGPVAVGACVVSSRNLPVPEGLRDSKLLTQKRRETLLPALREWGQHAVGYATAAEIDARGITWALGAAALRALDELHEAGADVPQATVVLDGTHDWLSPVLPRPMHVVTRARADRDCASAAAASVLAKVERDSRMSAAHAEHPPYLWNSNKGYGSRAHYAAIDDLGLTPEHRQTWIRRAGARGRLTS